MALFYIKNLQRNHDCDNCPRCFGSIPFRVRIIGSSWSVSRHCSEKAGLNPRFVAVGNLSAASSEPAKMRKTPSFDVFWGKCRR